MAKNFSNIHIYVMNPPKFLDRRASLEKILSELNFNYSFISINDEIELSPEGINKNHNKQKTLNSFGRDFSRGELASTLNHLHAYEVFSKSENDFAVIIEDDQYFEKEEFTSIFNALIQSHLQNDSPSVILLTPVISYMERTSKNLTTKFKLAKVFEAWGQAYIINRTAAKKIIKVNQGSWIIADDWVRYKRYAGIDLYGVIPAPIRTNVIFSSNLLSERRLSKRTNKTIKFALKKISYKIFKDLYKFFFLYPFMKLKRNKNGF